MSAELAGAGALPRVGAKPCAIAAAPTSGCKTSNVSSKPTALGMHPSIRPTGVATCPAARGNHAMPTDQYRSIWEPRWAQRFPLLTWRPGTQEHPMAYRNLEISHRDGIRSITVNRPDKLNALNRDTLNELGIAFAQAAADDDVRVVVLGGAGDKAFVAGADIAEMHDYTPRQAQDFSRRGQQLMSAIERLRKP